MGPGLQGLSRADVLSKRLEVDLSYLHKSPMRLVPLLIFTDEGSQTQRGEDICLRSHSMSLAELGFEPRQSGPRVF